MKFSYLRAGLFALAATTALTSAASAAETVKATYGIIFGAAVPQVACGAIPMAEDQALKDLGFDITVIHSAQLGSENQLAEQVSFGELEMSTITSSIFAAWLENISVLEAYYLYDNVDQVMKVFNTPTAKALTDELLEVSSIRVVGSPWLYGVRNVFGKKEIHTPEDFSGLRMRVPETPVSIEGAKSLGAQPTPVAYSELYLALQQGIVDAAEAPIPNIALESFDEPADFVMLTRHLITASPFVVNEDFWQSLTEEQQVGLTKAANEASARVRECVEKAEVEALAKWKEGGQVKVIEDIDREAIKAASRAHFSEGLPYSGTYVKLIEDLK